MAASHLLDTSVYSQLLKPLPLVSVVVRWEHLGDAALAVSAICEAEVLYGIALQPAAASTLRARYEQHLRGRLALLPVDAAVAAAFATLKAGARNRGQLLPDFDLLIAATAFAHDLTVATLNVRHFTLVPGIRVEDWSLPPPPPPP